MAAITDTPTVLGELAPNDVNPTHIAELDSNNVLQWAKYTHGISEEKADNAKALALKNSSDLRAIQQTIEDLGIVHDYGLNQKLGHLTDAAGDETLAAVLRWMGGSGILGVRQGLTNPTLDAFNRKHDTPSASMNLHEHSNYLLMPGLGELAMIVNGYYYQSRHNDYTMRKSIIGDGFTTERIPPLELPSSIAALPTGVSGATVDKTGATQANYLYNIHTDNPADVTMYLAYAEIYWQIKDGDAVTDIGDSFRHSNSEGELITAYDNAVRIAAIGSKDRLENTPFTPVSKRVVRKDGSTVTAYLNFRIMCYPVGTLADVGVSSIPPQITIIDTDSHGHVLTSGLTLQQANDLRNSVVASVTLTSEDSGHFHEYVITFDGTDFQGVDTNNTHQHEVRIEYGYDGSLPYDAVKAANGVTDNSNVFKLVDPILWPAQYKGMTNSEVVNTRAARFTVEGIERICERIPGLDGEGASMRETDLLEGNFSLDRDGGMLNAAYYSHTIGIGTNDAMGLGGYGRGINDPNLFTARTENPAVLDGVSYMIPLELLSIDPAQGWNPYDFEAAANYADVTGGGTSVNPYTKVFQDGFWYTVPINYYSETAVPDPADTGKTKWVKDSDGVARQVSGGGIRPFLPNGRRLRFPIYPVYQDYSYEGVRNNLLNESVKDIGKIQYVDGLGETDPSTELSAIIDAISSDQGRQLHVSNVAGAVDEPTTRRYYWGTVSDGASGHTPSWIKY